MIDISEVSLPFRFPSDDVELRVSTEPGALVPPDD